MRKIAATYIFPVKGKPVKNGILVLEDDGTVIDLVEKADDFGEEAGVEFYSGILVPGFVNAHCHLELSHLHQKIDEKTGIGGFIGQINRLRNATEPEMQHVMQLADRRMYAAGTAAVGDISNTMLSLSVKLKSHMQYHTFVETFGFHPSRADRAFNIAETVKNEFRNQQLPASIVPHSPYSVSEPLFRKIETEARKEKGILSIHNQESEGETEFYRECTGPIADHLQYNLGLDISHWQSRTLSSLQSILEYVPVENHLLLVHNTFSRQEDLQTLLSDRRKENTFLVLCPNSNLYIENTLPPVEMFRKTELNICLGTDSLASNHQLSVLEEMITIQENFPNVALEELISWACLNGALALQMEDKLGSFERGKKPGVNLIAALDLKQLKLTSKSRVKRLV